MVPEVLADLISTQRNRPLGLAVTVLALFGPASLTIFLSRPSIYAQVGLNGVVLLSISISFPIVMLCFAIWYTPLSALLQVERLTQGKPTEPDDLEAALKSDDPLEWPCLLAAGWTANLILFSIAALAYWRPLRIGATFLLTAAILLGLWLMLLITSFTLYSLAERRLKTNTGSGSPPRRSTA